MLVSICTIALNEAECLPRALSQWRALGDELIVVVDNRTTDNTAQIVRDMGGSVVPFEYVSPGHKGEARNAGIDRAHGQWIVVLDADEIIADPIGLRLAIETMTPEMMAAYVRFENYGANGEVTLSWFQPRIFRRGLYRYRHREHEVPMWCGHGTPFEVNIDTLFEHRPPAGRDDAKAKPMLERLLLSAQEIGDMHSLYFLHRQYLIAGEWQQCIEWGHKYLEAAGALRLPNAYGNLADAYVQLGDRQEALNWLHEALAVEPHRRRWWLRIGELHAAAGQWNVAMAYLRGGGELQTVDEWEVEPQAYDVGMRNLMAYCEHELVHANGVEHSHS